MSEGAREFLASVWRAKMAVQRCMWDVGLLRDRCEHITACLEGEKGTSGDPHRDGVVAALADKKTELLELERRLEQKEREAEDFLDRIGDERCRAILRLRYVERLRWTAIQERLEAMSFYYSERQIYNLHKKAVRLAEQLYTDLQELPRGA